MRIGIVVDSACDLPPDYIEHHGIVMLPISVRIGETVLADHRDEQATLSFLHSDVAKRAAEAETIPYTAQQIRDLFLQRLVIDFDHVFCTTISSTRSPIFDNATQASFAILNDYKPVRQAAGYTTPFALRVVDSRNLFAAQAVPAVEAVRLREAGASVQAIRERMEHVADHLHGYLVPRDLYYIRARGRAKGERSVGLLSAALGSALDIKPILHCHRGQTAPVAKVKGFEQASEHLFGAVAKRVRHGLVTPVLCVSYGGELSELQALPGYRELRLTCAEHDVELHESVMSLTGMINVGKGAVAVGYADVPHAID
jgi:DegV family protein with EDD domain